MLVLKFTLNSIEMITIVYECIILTVLKNSNWLRLFCPFLRLFCHLKQTMFCGFIISLIWGKYRVEIIMNTKPTSELLGHLWIIKDTKKKIITKLMLCKGGSGPWGNIILIWIKFHPIIFLNYLYNF